MRHDLSSNAAYDDAIKFLSTTKLGDEPHSLDGNAVWKAYKASGEPVGRASSNACHGSCSFENVSLLATQNKGKHGGGWGYSARSSGYGIPQRFLNGPLSDDVLTAWTDWLIHRSWASSHVMAPDVEFARDYGFVFDCTQVSGNLALALCTLSRHAGEHSHLVQRWFDLLEKYPFMTPDAAYAIAFGVITTGKPYGNNIGGHATLQANDSIEYLRNAATQNIVHSTPGTASSGGVRMGVTAMWGSLKSTLAKELKDLEPRIETTGVVIPNPFAPVAKTSAAISEKLLDAVMPDLVSIISQPVPNKKETRLAA